MRILIIHDTKINQTELTTLKSQFTDWMKTNAEIKPTYKLLPYDYSDYPTYPDSDGDQRPTPTFLTKLKNEAYKLYRDTVDHVVVLVHQDNWKSDPPGPNNGI